MTQYYRLPNGTTTKGYTNYLVAWREKAKTIENLTGLQHIAFDPDIIFVDPQNRNYRIDIPVWFIEAIEEGLKNAKKY